MYLQVILSSLCAMPIVFVLYAAVPNEYSYPLMFSVAGVGVVNALYFPGTSPLLLSSFFSLSFFYFSLKFLRAAFEKEF